uniref:fibrillin-2-like n=1 Tax=Pristiophorus japonicus TaxID=55135 RepID=UPI00398EDA67
MVITVETIKPIWVAVYLTENSSCPSPSRLGPMCDVNYGKECMDDDDCDLWLTCCDAGCGKRCVHRASRLAEKTDRKCPEPSTTQHMCDKAEVETCESDRDCGGWKQCCDVGHCGKRCVYTYRLTMKQKKCPELSKVTFLCKKNFTQSCEDDDDCTAHKQCCDIGCGKKCVYSFTQGDKPGKCSPASRLKFVCNSTMGEACEGESHCGRWQTCCPTPCGARCVFKSFRGEDGSCPRPDLLARVCNSTFGKVCEEDGDCDGSQTCCDAGCQKRCVPSFFGKFHGGSSSSKPSTEWNAKECPAVSRLERVCETNRSESCEEDGDCGKWKRCCQTSCGRRCVHSFMGQGQTAALADQTAGNCPAPQRLSFMCELKFGEVCDDDDDCYAWQTCCNTSCGNRCVHSFSGKGRERRCPEPSRMTHICTMSFNTQCNNDSSCEGWQTCCDASCGNRCVPKFLTRATQCPASSRLDSFCEMRLGAMCESDADCLAWSSCCDADCGKRCVPRFFMAKDDTCPAPYRLAPMCDLKLGDQCSGDNDCDSWQTCCDTKCGKICVASFTDMGKERNGWTGQRARGMESSDDEKDECPDSYRARHICARNSSQVCRSDEECSSWKQCCDVGCGKRCVYSSWHSKRRQCPSTSSLSKVCTMKLGDECEGDGDCDRWQRCCNAGCGKRCVFKFFKGENSSCPSPSRLGPMCDVNYGKECMDDDDCDLWLTCCDAGCGKRCVHRASRLAEKTDRKCPEPSTTQHMCDKAEVETCESDRDCGGWKQCCDVGDCGKRCVYTYRLTMKQKKCPELSKVTFLCKKNFTQSCEDDDDCTAHKQCCDIGCGKKCVYSFTQGEASPRESPIGPRLHGLKFVCNSTMGEACEGESHCGRWQTCCPTPCGARCVFKSFRGEDGSCPRPDLLARVCNSTFGKVCEEDGDCDGSQTCCDAGCQKRCVPSFFGKFHGGSSSSKPSTEWNAKECPAVSRLERVCETNRSESCEEDGDCGKWKRCCQTSCGRRCVHSFMGQGQTAALADQTAGNCPAPQRLSFMCELKFGEVCDDDDDCYAWQTCCNTSCGNRCVHSFSGKGRERRCPEPSRMTHICTMSFNTQCNNDSSCEGWQTCCDASCGNRCVPKFLTRATQCPASSRLDSFCEMRLGAMCESDADCLAWSSCCDADCGKRCVPRFFMAKDDTCPAPYRLAPMCDLKLGDQCSGDNDCDIWQTCCDTKCGKICVASFTDMDEEDECPDSYRARHICARNSSQVCRSDEECSSWKQCCDVGCGKRCVYSSWHSKRRQCPSTSSLSKVCTMKLGDECEGDGDCDRWQRCCNAGCGKRCVFKFFKGENSSCPSPSRLGPMCDVNYGKECMDDDDCDLWLTCCDAGCGKRCVHRASRLAEKTDRKCPEPSTTQHMCDKAEVETCESDRDCGGWKQCCDVGHCGKRCVYTYRLTMKQKKCPELSKVTFLCKKNFTQSCEDDDDCTAHKQCCDIGCGKKCVYSFTQGDKPGKCSPASRLKFVCNSTMGEACEGESHCGRWQTCCPTPCGARCVFKSFRGEDSSCPRPDLLARVCNSTFGKVCEEDGDCDGSQTCCDAGCQKRCVPSFFGKFHGGSSSSKPSTEWNAKECPAVSRLERVCETNRSESCEEDGDCGKWKRCCQTSCGRRCVHSFMGQGQTAALADQTAGNCPAPQRLSFMCELKFGEVCDDDDDCYAWQTCCNTSCGNRCVHSFSGKGRERRCPEPSRMTHICTMSFNTQCNNDSSCEGWQTCCDASCGNRCVPKFLTRATQCPASSRLDSFCEMRLGAMCESDADCLAWSSCCDADCGKRCVPRFFMAKDDTCPAPYRLAPMCDLKLGDQCSGDNDCDSWQTCCDTKCGKICVASFTDMDEEDECPDSYRARHICARNSSQVCRSDEECSSWKQCCDVGCGKRCVYSSWHSKRRQCPSTSSLSKVCTMKLGDECEGDGDCDRWQRCCNAGCGKRCVFKFFKGENSSCPSPSRLGPMCDVNYGKECMDDDDCDLWLTCCDAGCGKRCVHRASRLAEKTDRKCPEPSTTQHMCDKAEVETCESDRDCGGWKQCCDVGDCGKRCVYTYRLTMKQKKCPELSKVTFLCKKNFTQSCEDDDDCTAHKQCCDIGCGKKCVYSFTQGDKPGKCSPASRLKFVCNSTMGEACEGESHCGRWQTCCPTPCGARCVFKSFRGEDGSCPRPDLLARVCNSTFGKVCEEDGDCDGSQTCCDAGCQKRCVPSFFGKFHGGSSSSKPSTEWNAKECPAVSRLERVCETNRSESCEEDGDCGKWKRCCQTSCGRRCVHSFMGQGQTAALADQTAGNCPAPQRLSFMCELKFGEVCDDDDDCYAWQTCCNTSCGNRCVHSFSGKGRERRCPEPSRMTHICTMSFNTQCNNDSSCEAWQTCCDASCGNRCVPKFLTRGNSLLRI